LSDTLLIDLVRSARHADSPSTVRAWILQQLQHMGFRNDEVSRKLKKRLQMRRCSGGWCFR